jgi:hypothetical protein
MLSAPALGRKMISNRDTLDSRPKRNGGEELDDSADHPVSKT